MARVQSCHHANRPYGRSDRTGYGESHVALGCLSSSSRSAPSDTGLAELVLLKRIRSVGQNGWLLASQESGPANYRIHPPASGPGGSPAFVGLDRAISSRGQVGE